MSEEFLRVDPELIDSLENIRHTVDEKKFLELKADIHHRGIQENVRIRSHPTSPGRYQVYGGRLRCRIALEAKLRNEGLDGPNGEKRTWTEAPLLVPAMLKDVDDLEAYAFTYSENVNRIDVDDYAEGCWLRLMKLKFSPISHEALGRKVTRSGAYISRMIAYANSIDSEGGLIPPSERSFRVFRKLNFEQQTAIKTRIDAGESFPSVRAMERMMKARSSAEAILKGYDPHTADDEFLKYVLQEEGGLTILEAKEEIRLWRRGVKTISVEDETPDQRYLKLQRYYPIEIIQIVSEDTDESKNLDHLAMRARMLVRAVWKELPEETRKRVIDEWKLRKQNQSQ